MSLLIESQIDNLYIVGVIMDQLNNSKNKELSVINFYNEIWFTDIKNGKTLKVVIK